MSRNLIIAAVALVAFVIVVAYFTFRTDRTTSAAPDGTYWVCVNPSCGNTFTLSLAELAAHHKAHYGEPVPCPKCKQPAVRAAKCANCGKVFPIDRGLVCPNCHTPAATLQYRCSCSKVGTGGRDASIRSPVQSRTFTFTDL
jgi:hypothetical protein